MQTLAMPTRLSRLPRSKWVRLNDAWILENCLYLIAEVGDTATKVGIATHPIRRLCSLQSGNPRRLYIYSLYPSRRDVCFVAERHLLSKYSDFSMVGEWLRLNPSVIADFIENEFWIDWVER
jgi:hypothetical protein